MDTLQRARKSTSTMKRSLGLGALVILIILVLSVSFQRRRMADVQRSHPPNSLLAKTSHKQVQENHERLPLSFEINQGQANSQVKFLSRGRGYSLLLTSHEAVLRLSREDSALMEEAGDSLPAGARRRTMEPRPAKAAIGVAGLYSPSHPSHLQSTMLHLKLVGAKTKGCLQGMDPLPGKVNYFMGNDPQKWRTHIPTYSRIKYPEVYPGIDLVFHGRQQQMEYDFIVSPYADPSAITLEFDIKPEGQGQTRLSLASNGDLVLETAGGEIRQHRPVVYQVANGIRHEIEGRYILKNKHQVFFQISSYESSLPLVIDPVLSYSTYLGGSANDVARRIAADSAGNVYVGGFTASTDFPTENPLQPTFGGSGSLSIGDAFITKLDSSGTQIVYSTYLGGSNDDFIQGIAVDSSGNAYMTGDTRSSNFPTVNPFQSAFAGGPNDAFVTKLNPSGDTLLYSTYLGGSLGDQPTRIVVDSAGNAYVTGQTLSNNFPSVSPFQTLNGGSNGAFVTKLDPTGSPVYSTYLGGGGNDTGYTLAVDNDGNAYVAGLTDSVDFPTKNALQTSLGGGGVLGDGFVTKLNPAGSELVYSTYLGGSGKDIPQDIVVDAAGSAFLTGQTFSSNFPTRDPLQPTLTGNSDAFVAKLSPSGSTFVYSTYLGGSGNDAGFGLVVNTGGEAYLTGWTDSINFPTVDALQPALAAGIDVFVAKLNAAGSALLFSTYLGGSGTDFGYAITLDDFGGIYVAGSTDSNDFPITGAFQSTRGGQTDAFVTKIVESVALFVPIVVSSAGLNNSFFTSELTLSNRGTRDATLDFIYTAALGGGSGTGRDLLAAGRQRIIADGISYLKGLGMPIPNSGNRGGTLSIGISGISNPSEVAVTVRTTTTVGNGRAGLAYAGIPISKGLSKPSYLGGLRQNAADRSNVALQNMGSATQGDIVLRLTVYSGDPAMPFSKPLPDVRLSPGGFTQINGILMSEGLSLKNGYVRIERMSGTAPYYAYAVINDQANSDGSFVPAVPENALDGRSGLTLPVIVETGAFSSELVLTNWSAVPRTLHFAFVADAIQAPGSSANFDITLNPGEQSILPNFIQWLRDRQVSGIGPAGPNYAGALFATVAGGDARGILLGARTSTPGGGGRYGLFYLGVPYGSAVSTSTWLYGLQQNDDNRTNLALVNTGETNTKPDKFRVEIYDGDSGSKVATLDNILMNALAWKQFDSLLAQNAPGIKQGFARVTRTSGSNPFIAYSVINDGAKPGERTGDGAFVSSTP